VRRSARYRTRSPACRKSQWPKIVSGYDIIAFWASKQYLVQVYEENDGIIRLSINRVSRSGGNWSDKITWDELQRIKSEVGFGAYYAYEVYPPDDKVVNEANMRHLWVTPVPMEFGW